jgi:hypothetical protein
VLNFCQLAVLTCQRAQGDRSKIVRESWVRLCGTYQSKGGVLASPEVRTVRFPILYSFLRFRTHDILYSDLGFARAISAVLRHFPTTQSSRKPTWGHAVFVIWGRPTWRKRIWGSCSAGISSGLRIVHAWVGLMVLSWVGYVTNGTIGNSI